MFNPYSNFKNRDGAGEEFKKEWMERYQRVQSGQEEVPHEFSYFDFKNLHELEENGGIQKFVIAESNGKLLFKSISSEHMKIWKALKEEFGEDIINRGGGFLSFDEYDKQLIILSKSSMNVGPIHIERDLRKLPWGKTPGRSRFIRIQTV